MSAEHEVASREDEDPWSTFVDDLRRRLRSAWSELDRALVDAAAGRHVGPGWSPLEIGEHVVLADHYLLLLARKIADKARARTRRGEPPPTSPSRCDALEKLAARDFRWSSPDHMLPTGRLALAEVRARLGEDLARCESLLAEFPAGEGALHRIRMSVVDERLDLYQFLCLIALHAERHAAQVRRSSDPSA